MKTCGKDKTLRLTPNRRDRFQSSFGSTEIIIYGPCGLPDSKLFSVPDFVLSDCLARYMINRES